MSQVMQNHVLRVGQTVCVSSREQSRTLRPPGYPGCSAMNCGYFSPQGWAEPPTTLPGGGLCGAHPQFGHEAVHTQGMGQRDTPLDRPTASQQPEEEEDAGTDHLVSPTLDISIESLNQLILEIDPTFQPLTCEPGKDVVQRTFQGDVAATKKPEPEAIDIKYIEMTPGSALSPVLLRGPPSPSARAAAGPTQPFSHPNLKVPPGPTSPRLGTRSRAVSPTSSKASECVAVPRPCTAAQTNSISYGPDTPGSSPGLDALLRPVQVVRAQRSSHISLLSTSPGSDTSYILGSSTHSLHHDDSDAHPAACASPASPCPSPATTGSRSEEPFGLSLPQPVAACSPKASLSPKGQASSCPPSILSSAAEIPVLLVNGCLQQAEEALGLPRAPPAITKQSPPPSGPPRLGGLNAALSAPALSCAPDGPLGTGQPTMKFVMDTSRYWFKPSISRDR
ncbi:PREDICTED: tensin-4, partial [Mesitornis unicolor]|uniref:tensin-4 n=1 Tax=Mesitornis unicolor TaxID=54374 RepID=UPI00052876B7